MTDVIHNFNVHKIMPLYMELVKLNS